MARLIKIPADGNELVEVEINNLFYPQLNQATVGEDNRGLCLIEQVRPKGFIALSEELQQPVTFIVDEEGLSKGLPLNVRASYLYGTHVHRNPVAGDAWVLVEERVDGEWEWAGLPDSITIPKILDAIWLAAMSPELFA